jgi:hypothetical protein
VHGAIDGTHISISKPKLVFVKDYYYHKSGSYSIVAQVVVDVRRKFINLYVGLPVASMILEFYENLGCTNKFNIKGFSIW